ncbi:diguanylate cyclase domain-containing protein [Oceanicoccus sp. KOV_DT_Chl]|uniref:GGDEF domain-containing protein n=1 Tax=Oceanicoccus sp. KOV_DT_Chl TaxID=1904639 RepID=UPI000C7D5BBC|nr:diguanylate cyclase [Oceanicoccus sp. KOV_DT_Chl]
MSTTSPQVLLIASADVIQAPLFQQLQAAVAVLHAQNADQVIDITTDEQVQLVVVDSESMGEAAFEICMWLKSDAEVRSLPVVVLSSELTAAVVGRWLNIGVADVFDTGFPVELLTAKVNTLLELSYKTELLAEVASLDALTSVADKQRLTEYLDIEWRRSLREYYPLSLIKFDIDQFTGFNDVQGIGLGDAALKRIAKVLQNNCQRAADMVSRYENDEFVVLLPAIELENALAVAERMVQAVADLAIDYPDSDSGVLTISAGVATIEPSRDKRVQDLFDEADEMLDSAQQQGGNQTQGVSL